MTTHHELLFPGFLQGLFSGHLVFLLFPLLLLFLLRLPCLLCLLCLFRLMLPMLFLNVLMGHSYLGPRHLLNPGLLGRHLTLLLLEILFRIRVYQNRFWVYDSGGDSPCVDVLGGGHNAGVLDWKKEILTLPMITICLICPGASFHLYFELRQTSHGTSLVSAFPQDLGTRSLRGEYCYIP